MSTCNDSLSRIKKQSVNLMNFSDLFVIIKAAREYLIGLIQDKHFDLS